MVKHIKSKKIKHKSKTLFLNKSLLIFLVSVIVMYSLVLADVIITQIQPTGNITTSNTSVVIEYNFSTDYLQNLTWSWDGTDYLIDDPSLVLHMDFDNRSELDECFTNATGCVKDLSRYGNNGTLVGNWLTNGTKVSDNITWTPSGKYGGAYRFYGISGKQINLGNSVSLNFDYQKNYTWVFWANLTTTSIGTQDIFYKGADGYG